MPREPRAQVIWDLHDLSQGRGLEIGPLDRPLVRRDEGDVRYLDVIDGDALRAHYASDAAVVNDNIVDPDYVLVDRGVTRTAGQAAREGAPFAWVVAAHVVEHVPDLAGWLDDLAELVEDDGMLLLVVPDMRFTFDLHRSATSLGEIVEAHDERRTRPSVRAVLDHVSMYVEVGADAAWRGARPGLEARRMTLEDAWAQVDRSRSGDYVDSHVWMFTPDVFLTQMRDLRRSGLSSWTVEAITPTPRHQLEFYVRLRRVPRALDAATADLPDEVQPTDERPFWMAEMDRATTEVAELRRKVRRQRRRIAAQQREIDALTGSVRWRVGHAVVAPFSRVRRTLGRR